MAEEEENVETPEAAEAVQAEDATDAGAPAEAPAEAEPAATSEASPEGSGSEAEQPSAGSEQPSAGAEQPSEGSEPAAEAAAPAEPDPLDDLSPKERRRILKSRKPHQARPQRSPEERQAERDAERKRKAAQRAKRRAAAKAEAKQGGTGTGTPPAEHTANAPKTRQGVVVSNKADKTITVRIDIARRHRIYEKIVRQSRTLHVHDERNEAAEGDVVRVVETRPLSKTKRWRLVEIVEKAR